MTESSGKGPFPEDHATPTTREVPVVPPDGVSQSGGGAIQAAPLPPTFLWQDALFIVVVGSLGFLFAHLWSPFSPVPLSQETSARFGIFFVLAAEIFLRFCNQVWEGLPCLLRPVFPRKGFKEAFLYSIPLLLLYPLLALVGYLFFGNLQSPISNPGELGLNGGWLFYLLVKVFSSSFLFPGLIVVWGIITFLCSRFPGVAARVDAVVFLPAFLIAAFVISTLWWYFALPLTIGFFVLDGRISVSHRKTAPVLFFLLVVALLWATGGAADRKNRSEGIVIAHEESGQWGFCNGSGTWLITPRFEGATDFFTTIGPLNQRMAGVKMGGKWGYINLAGEMIIPPSFKNIDRVIGFNGFFEMAPACVEVDGLWGFINAKGNMVIEPRFDAGFGFTDGLAAVKVHGKWGYIDPQGLPVFPVTFERAYPFNHGMAVARIDKTYVLLDRKGVRDAAAPVEFSEGFAPLDLGERKGFINTDGEVVILPRFADAGAFSEGLAPVKERFGGNWGFIDVRGQMVIPPMFEEVQGFGEGMAPVKIKGLWGFADRLGKTLIQPQFQNAGSHFLGVALVEKKGELFFIDRLGAVSKPPRSLMLAPLNNKIARLTWKETGDYHAEILNDLQFSEGLAPIKIGKTWGYIDRIGRLRIRPNMVRPGDFKNGSATVWIGQNVSLSSDVFISCWSATGTVEMTDGAQITRIDAFGQRLAWPAEEEAPGNPKSAPHPVESPKDRVQSGSALLRAQEPHPSEDAAFPLESSGSPPLDKTHPVK